MTENLEVSTIVFTVFVSHSTRDLNTVNELANWLRANNVAVHVAESQIQAGKPLPKKISNLLESSDCVIALLTRGGVRSEWVNQEIGYAIRAGKLVVPIVEEGVMTKGFLQSLEYIPFDRRNPYDAVIRAVEYMQTLALRKGEEERRRLVFGGLLFLFGLLALSTGAQ